jgi:hypothetical protein
MNAILETILSARKGMYCHALEVNDVYELQSVIDALYDEFINDYDVKTLIDFITSLELYCLCETNEGEVYNFSVEEYINSL